MLVTFGQTKQLDFTMAAFMFVVVQRQGAYGANGGITMPLRAKHLVLNMIYAREL